MRGRTDPRRRARVAVDEARAAGGTPGRCQSCGSPGSSDTDPARSARPPNAGRPCRERETPAWRPFLFIHAIRFRSRSYAPDLARSALRGQPEISRRGRGASRRLLKDRPVAGSVVVSCRDSQLVDRLVKFPQEGRRRRIEWTWAGNLQGWRTHGDSIRLGRVGVIGGASRFDLAFVPGWILRWGRLRPLHGTRGPVLGRRTPELASTSRAVPRVAGRRSA